MTVHRTASLDAFRVVAINFVMLAHGVMLGMDAIPAMRYVAIIFGVLGVELFFVLSGFLIGRQLLNVGLGDQSIKSFWWRRWFRTLPNYYLFLFVNALFFAHLLQKPLTVVPFVFFSHALISPCSTSFFGESWSLAVEEWFYLLAPMAVVLAARLVSGRRRQFVVLAVMIGVIAGSALARLLVAQQTEGTIDSALRKMVMVRLDALAFGVLLAWLERYRAPLMALFSRLWWVGALVSVLAIAYLGTLARSLAFLAPPSGADRMLAPLLFTLLPLACTLLLAKAATINVRERTWVGNQSKWSYSMYLFHVPLLHLILQVSSGFNNHITLLAAIAAWYTATVFGAAFIYRGFEKPIMDLRERFVPLQK